VGGTEYHNGEPDRSAVCGDVCESEIVNVREVGITNSEGRVVNKVVLGCNQADKDDKGHVEEEKPDKESKRATIEGIDQQRTSGVKEGQGTAVLQFNILEG
jgi:hypothetical protein